MGSMHTNLEELPQGFERLAAFYGERASAGVGLIITGGISPNQEGILAPNRSVLDSIEGVLQGNGPVVCRGLARWRTSSVEFYRQ